MTIRPTVGSSRGVCERSPVAIIKVVPLKCFCFAPVQTSVLQFLLTLLFHPPFRSLVLNINVSYANGLTPAEVDQAPPLNVNPLPHLHMLKCQIPPQITAGASITARPAPAQKQCGRNRMHSIKSTSKACLDCRVRAGSRCVK